MLRKCLRSFTRCAQRCAKSFVTLLCAITQLDHTAYVSQLFPHVLQYGRESFALHVHVKLTMLRHTWEAKMKNLQGAVEDIELVHTARTQITLLLLNLTSDFLTEHQLQNPQIDHNREDKDCPLQSEHTPQLLFFERGASRLVCQSVCNPNPAVV